MTTRFRRDTGSDKTPRDHYAAVTDQVMVLLLPDPHLIRPLRRVDWGQETARVTVPPPPTLNWLLPPPAG